MNGEVVDGVEGITPALELLARRLRAAADRLRSEMVEYGGERRFGGDIFLEALERINDGPLTPKDGE